jgi:hypothetical protein
MIRSYQTGLGAFARVTRWIDGLRVCRGLVQVWMRLLPELFGEGKGINLEALWRPTMAFLYIS